MSFANNEEDEIKTLYHELLDSWNHRDAEAMAKPFAENGEMIGFDGSQIIGKEKIALHLGEVFTSHLTPVYVSKVKKVRFLGADVAILRAVAGMVLPGKSELEPSLNTHQTLIAAKLDNNWQIELFQNTPAQFHGRPDLTKALTNELREVYKA